MPTPAHPLDLEKKAYSYVERCNPAILDLMDRHVVRDAPRARILDIGCGCGANARALKQRTPTVWITGIEPTPVPPSSHETHATRCSPGSSTNG